MSTGNKKVDIFLKKFLPQQQMTENFFDLLENKIHESIYWMFRNSGVFTPDVTVQDILSSPGANLLDFFTPLTGTDGPLGHIINLDPIDAQNVQFENANAVLYHTGLRFNRLPVDTEVNVRTGKIKYTFLSEAIGELAEPDLVVDDGDGTLTITVDAVAEAGVSNAGRKVIVWLKDAVSQVEAFEEATIVFSGGANKIFTTGALGQQIGNISVDPTMYQVFLRGPTIRRNTDLRLDPNVVYTGNVIGNGGTPTVFDHTDVVNLSAGLGTLSSLFYVEHSNVDGTHTDITPETITTKQSQPGVQLDTRVNAGDEDVPDAPVAHTLFQSGGGSGIQAIKWRLRDSTGAVIAMIDAHGNAYFQNLAAITSIFQQNLVVQGQATLNGNTVLGDDILTDETTLNSKLKSLSDMYFGIDSNNNGTGHAFRFFNNDWLTEIFKIEEDGDLQLFGNIFSNNPGLNIDLDSDNNTTGELLQITKNGGLDTLLQLLEAGDLKLFGDKIFTDKQSYTFDLDSNADDADAGSQFRITMNNLLSTLWVVNGLGDATSFRDTIGGRDVLTQLGAFYQNAVGTAIPTNASLNEVYDQTLFRKLLRITPSNPNDKVVNIAASRIQNADGSDHVLPIGVLISNYLGGTINFATGVITGGGANFTPTDFAGQANKFSKYSINLLADNTILVIAAEGFGTTKANAPEPTLARGAIGFAVVAVQDDGSAGVGTILNISEANFTRIPSAGGGGSGTGDASTFELEVRDRLRDSIWSWVMTNIPASDEFDYIDDPNSTAVLDVANGLFKFNNIADVLQSIQSYGSQFLLSSKASEKIELWTMFETEDAAMVHEVSRDGGLNWLTVVMAKMGGSKLYTGTGVFPDPVTTETLKEYPTAVTPSTVVMTDLVFSRAVKIIVTEKSKYLTYALKYNKTGTPSGNFFVNLVKDSAGSPSTSADDVLASSNPIASSALLAGANTLNVSVPSILPAGTYWFVVSSDAAYRSSYVAATHQVALQSDSAGTYVGGDSKQFDGTTWTTSAGQQILFTTAGFRFILLVKLTSSIAGATLEDYAVFFGETGQTLVTALDESQTFRFTGSEDKTDFLVTNFLPDPGLVVAEFVNAGLHFVFPFFDIDGHTLKFKAGTFLYPSAAELIVKIHQKQGSSFDNSDRNASLLAANHLGSTDGAIDMSSAGRGILLRRRGDGLLRELIINETDDIEILSVP